MVGTVIRIASPDAAVASATTQVTLLCDTSRVCGTTGIGQDGTFSFTDLTPGMYGLRVQRDGYYTEDFSKVEVRRGLELDYRVHIEACQQGDCDPKKRRAIVYEGIWL